MEETFFDRLKKEQLDLQSKIAKLGDFLTSNNFDKIPELQQSLLLVQLKAMETYNKCLVQRMRYINEP